MFPPSDASSNEHSCSLSAPPTLLEMRTKLAKATRNNVNSNNNPDRLNKNKTSGASSENKRRPASN